MVISTSKPGLVQVFWGDGKGKTTAALGTAVRALGNGMRVHLVQFMKNGAESLEQEVPGEIASLTTFDSFSYKRFGMDGWVIGAPTANQKLACKDALNSVIDVMNGENPDIVIADEILYAVQFGLLLEEDLLLLMESKPANVELIMTGSHVPLLRVFKRADLVSEVRKVKHPFDNGVLARRGLDF